MKLPYFSFYVNDWLSSNTVSDMSDAEQGIYVRALCRCWSGEGLPIDDETCMLRINCTDKTLYNTVIRLFKFKVDGKRWNSRLYEEFKIAKRLHEKKSFGGKKAMEKRWKRDKTLNKTLNKTLYNNQSITQIQGNTDAAASLETPPQATAKPKERKPDVFDEMQKEQPPGFRICPAPGRVSL